MKKTILPIGVAIMVLSYGYIPGYGFMLGGPLLTWSSLSLIRDGRKPWQRLLAMTMGALAALLIVPVSVYCYNTGQIFRTVVFLLGLALSTYSVWSADVE